MAAIERVADDSLDEARALRIEGGGAAPDERPRALLLGPSSGEPGRLLP
ncbi:MAG: hypothetical protein KDB94_02660 [Acidobacteria bacterium]|nr:hypothetical protein [Acidobacteriota bacterium]MCB9378582.1 hypothetical protein [Holophagales bacterium]